MTACCGLRLRSSDLAPTAHLGFGVAGTGINDVRRRVVLEFPETAKMPTFQIPLQVDRQGTQMGSHAFDESRPSVTPNGEPNNGTQGNAPPEGMLLRTHSA